MKRLREQRQSSDPAVARAAELLAARAPLADDPVRQARVRARLSSRRRVSPRARWLARLASVVLLTGGVALGATVIGRVAQEIRQWQAARQAETRAAVARPSHGKKLHPGAPVAAAPVAAPSMPLEPAPVAPAPVAPAPSVAPSAPPAPVAPAPSVATSAPVSTAAPASPAPRAVHAPAPAPADVETEAQQLLTSAVRALRHEHDAARATTLLTRYLARYPDGVGAEDALALALEATLDRDPPRAAAFAARYLARYPSGRWAPLAQRALAR
jgi:TolA-binding protein